MPPILARSSLLRLTVEHQFRKFLASLLSTGRLFIVNIAQLRESIFELLSSSPNILGNYVLPNGDSIPAIYVVGQNSVPSEWKVNGLEVTMRQYPELLPNAGVGMAKVLQQWEVVMVQYNPDGKEIAEAMDRMVRRFPDGAFRHTPGDDVAYERCRVIIPDMTVRSLYPRQQ